MEGNTDIRGTVEYLRQRFGSTNDTPVVNTEVVSPTVYTAEPNYKELRNKVLMAGGAVALTATGLFFMIFNQDKGIPIVPCGTLSPEQVSFIKSAPVDGSLTKEAFLQQLGPVNQPCKPPEDISFRTVGGGQEPIILSRLAFGLQPGEHGEANEIVVSFENFNTTTEGQELRGFSFVSPTTTMDSQPNFPRINSPSGFPIGSKIGNLTVTHTGATIGVTGSDKVIANDMATLIAPPENAPEGMRNLIAVRYDRIPGWVFIVGNVKDPQTKRVKKGEVMFYSRDNSFSLTLVTAHSGAAALPAEQLIRIFFNQP